MPSLFYQIFNKNIELTPEIIKDFIKEVDKLYTKFSADKDLDNLKVLKNKLERLLDEKARHLSKKERKGLKEVDEYIDKIDDILETKKNEDKKIELIDVVEEEVMKHYKSCKNIDENKLKKYKKVCVKKKNIKYEKELVQLQVELLKLQKHIKDKKEKLLIIFEGRDAAGKGGTIKRFREHLNPRGARLVALEKPNEVEKTEWYFQRYVKHLPAGGEMVFFDRSWYNRAGVEPVMGFVSEANYEKFLRDVPRFEEMLVDAGVKIVKFYFTVSKKEQGARFEARKTNPLKQFKLSPIDQYSQQLWGKYSLAEYNNFKHTHTKHAPWIIIHSDDKKKARLNAIRHVLSLYNYPEKNEKLLKFDKNIVETGKKRLKTLEKEIDTKEALFD